MTFLPNLGWVYMDLTEWSLVNDGCVVVASYIRGAEVFER